MKQTTRREFLKQSLTGAGLTLALTLAPGGFRLLKAEDVKTQEVEPNAWIRIYPDNTVTIIVNKSEMGQGVSTALPMIVADELEADWKLVRFVESPARPVYTDPETGQQLTGGSTSVRHMYQPLRTAGAAAREMLILAAAQAWAVPAEECRAVEGNVVHTNSSRSAPYGQVADAAAKLPVPGNPHLKEESQFNLIGKPLPRLDIPDKVNGKAAFGIDVSLPGMVYAAIARPPAYGAKVKSVERGAAHAVPGVVQVVPVKNGIAVVAKSLPAAWKGRKALQPVWGNGTHPDMDTKSVEKTFLQHLDRKGIVAKNQGDARRALGSAEKRIRAVYTLPYLAHVTMEPMDCTAHVSADRCDIWAPTQNQSGVLKSALKITGLKPEQIHIHTTYLGGGYGRRGDVDYADEVLAIAKATGSPVKLIWTREEDIRNDVFRPGYACRIEGAVDAAGRITAWSHKVAVQSIFERFAPQRLKNGVDPAAVEGIVDMDYEIPNVHVEWINVKSPIQIGFWRSVGNSQNGFTTESFMDELAHAAKKDPVEFRLGMLKEHLPAVRLIETVAEKAGWGKPPQKGQAMGLAYHLAFGSRCAQVAEVSLNEKEGSVRVHRVVCAIDCGPVVVNPAILTAQARGAITMGLSAALNERIEFAKGGVASSNFNDYHELRISDAPPDIEVHILKNQKSMGGIGEPPLPPIAPAVANAVFAATGRRIRKLPLMPELKRALG